MPDAPPPQNPPPRPDARPSHDPPPRPGVLVVDDDPLVGRMLITALGGCGFTVHATASGVAALRAFEALSPAPVLALLDVYMRETDGLETLRLLRGRDPALPCCFMTGYGGTYTVQHLLGQGAAHVFIKPFPINQLTDAVRRMVFGPAAAAPPAAAPAERRRFPRWAGTPFEVAVAPAAGPAGPQTALVYDRSLGGLGLLADVAWPAGTTLRVSRASSGAGPFLEVRHARPEGGRWAVGCRFAVPPPLDLLLGLG